MKSIDIESIPRPSKGHVKQQTKNKVCMPFKSKSCHSNGKSALGSNPYLRYIGAFILLFLTIWGGYVYKKRYLDDIKVQDLVFESVYAFEQSDFEQALQGNSSCLGFLKILKRYPHVKSAALVRFYTGLAYMHQKQYDQAIVYLEACKVNSKLVQARVYCVLADAYSYKQQWLKAGQTYIKAARCANSIYAPDYWIKAALAFQHIQQYQQAYDCYQYLIKTYPKTSVKSYAIEEAARLALLLS